LRDDATKTKQKCMDEVAQADFRTDAEREECGGVLPRAEVARVAFLLAVRRKPARRTDRSDPGQLDQQLPPARDGSATLMQLLMNLPSWPANDLDAWLPDRWKQAHADRCAALEIPPLDS
jgi:hypothetical protein